ncbi:MAG: 5'/3'-nucleotidase SurE [Chloroflexi bacterium]|nr:5'/3'-nucleotidase SurE [Chloroflexota bacterium]
MYILTTNDDGIDSEGLLLLKQSLATVGEVVVIAPDQNWSAAGHTKTLQKPLRVTQVALADGDLAYSTDGTPSDCVSLGILGILERKPDLVVAGINKGPNLGDDVTYSGTVAAAMEATISGIPAIAVSLADYSEWDFAYAARFTAQLARRMVDDGLGSNILLNVNVPNISEDEIAGIEITRLGKRVYRDVLVKRTDPLGQTYYLISGDVPTGLPLARTDFKAITENKISITPIHLDLTNHRLIKHLQQWNLKISG